MFKDSDFDVLDDLVDEGMAFVQEKDAENQGKIGVDDIEVVNTAGEGVSTAAPRTPPTTTIVFNDKDVTIAMAQTFIKMKEEKAKEKGVAIKDETEPVEKTKKKVQGDAQIERDARIDADYELATRMTQEEQKKYTIKERARLVQERFQDHPLKGNDLLLWGDLRKIFDPDEEDKLWMNQLDWKLLR
ncbi:hypothetical protein Tco_0199339 [Tanacetum coccineum]